MATLTFDTLKFTKRLREAGVPDKQAEAEAEALAEVIAEAVKASDLANKQDLRDMELALRKDARDLELALKKDLHDMELRVTKWVIALALAQIGLLLGVLMRMPH